MASLLNKFPLPMSPDSGHVSAASSDRTLHSNDSSAITSPTGSALSRYARSNGGSKTSLALRPKTAGDTNYSPVKGSKDWLDLRMAMGSPIEIATDNDVFRFPTPVKRPNTSGSAHNSHMFDESSIGIALGSPTQMPPARGYVAKESGLKHVVEQTKPKPVRANTTKELRNEDMDGSRPKLSRWRSLGGLFGKRRPSQTQQFLTSQSSSNGSMNDSIDNLSSSSRAMSPQNQRPEPGLTTTISANAEPVSSPGLFRRVTKKGTKVRSPSRKDRKTPSPPPKPTIEEPEEAPQLDITIPEPNMERYSVLFKEVTVLPTRSSSLLARRQATGERNRAMTAGAVTQLDIPPSGLIRRATEPSPRDSASYKLFPEGARTPKTPTRLPHISTLHRPRPIKRNVISPPTLQTPTVPLYDQRLSPAFEADELAFDDENRLTPTPSTPASPSTPKSLPLDPSPTDKPSPGRLSVRKNSWDTTTSKPLTESSWEMITVAKRLSPADLLPKAQAAFAVPPTHDLLPLPNRDSEVPQVGIARSLSVTKAKAIAPTEPKDQKPHTATVGIARSLSVTKAKAVAPVEKPSEKDSKRDTTVGIARSLSVTKAARPTRVASKRAAQPKPASANSSAPHSPPVSPPSESPAATSPAVVSPLAASPLAGTPTVGTPTVDINRPIPRSGSRRQELQLDLTREIWGERGFAGLDGSVRENKAGTPRLCVVEDGGEGRKSVWGVIETTG